MREAPALPPEGLRPPGERPRDDDRPTRKPLGLWDRVKFLIVLVLIWFILVWSAMANNPLVGFSDARADRGQGRRVGLRPDRS